MALSQGEEGSGSKRRCAARVDEYRGRNLREAWHSASQGRAQMLTLRPYQQRGLDMARAAFRAGKRRVLLVAPTGAGKTILFSAIVAGHLEKGGRVLVVVHRREL